MNKGVLAWDGGRQEGPEVSELNGARCTLPSASPTAHHAQLRDSVEGDSVGGCGGEAQGTWLCSHGVRISLPSLGHSLPPPPAPPRDPPAEFPRL